MNSWWIKGVHRTGCVKVSGCVPWMLSPPLRMLAPISISHETFWNVAENLHFPLGFWYTYVITNVCDWGRLLRTTKKFPLLLGDTPIVIPETCHVVQNVQCWWPLYSPMAVNLVDPTLSGLNVPPGGRKSATSSTITPKSSSKISHKTIPSALW